VIHVLISALYKLFVCVFIYLPSSLAFFLTCFLPHLLSSLLSFFLMLSFLLIYFLTRLFPDLSIYSFQNRPIPFLGQGS